jgi:DNA-binding SARP family transcriptional activator/TolB-like protein/Tfp pilus assembly protein PilF
MNIPRPQLRLLGGPGIETEDGGSAGLAARRHPIALAAILAVEGGGIVTRDRLVALLWPEADAESARNRLRVSLHALRDVFGKSAIVSVADGVRLDVTRIPCDLLEFVSAREAGRTELVVEAYRGPFLDGFHLPDSVEFDQWADTQRDRLGRDYRDALEALAEGCEATGEMKAAAEWWRKRAAEEPANARVVVRLMEAMERAGDRAGALREADRHAQLLRQEFDSDEAPEVVALTQRLRAEPHRADIGGSSAQPPHAIRGPPAQSPHDPSADSPVPVPHATSVATDLTSGLSDRASAGANKLVWLIVGYPMASAISIGVLSVLVVRYSWALTALRAGVLLFATGWVMALAVAYARNPHRPRPGIAAALAASVLLLAVLAGGWVAASRAEQARSASTVISRTRIAVLLCNQIPTDSATEHLAVGLTDRVITELSRSSRLTPIALASVLRYRGLDRDIGAIANELRVGTIVDCTMRQDDGQIRVAFHLIDAATQAQLWGEPYALSFRDVIGSENQIAQRIATALDLRLDAVAKLPSTPRLTSAEAWSEYLRGRQRTGQRRRDIERAVRHFENAIHLDPGFALAHAGLADAVVTLGVFGLWPPQQARDSALSAALQALALDAGLAEGFSALAAVRFWFDWNWVEAEDAFLQARKLQPKSVKARSHHAAFLIAMQRYPEAFTILRENLDLDPMNPAAYANLGWAHFMAGQYDSALELAHQGRRHDGRVLLAWIYSAKGMHADALAAADSAAIHWSLDDPWLRTSLAAIRATAGKRADAEMMLDALRTLRTTRYVDPRNLAVLHAALGDTSRALDELEKSHRLGSPEMVWLHPDRRGLFTRALRGTARYAAIVREMKFPTNGRSLEDGNRAR